MIDSWVQNIIRLGPTAGSKKAMLMTLCIRQCAGKLRRYARRPTRSVISNGPVYLCPCFLFLPM